VNGVVAWYWALLERVVGWLLGHHTSRSERDAISARIDALNTERGFQ
jgi:hypothetical protein